MIVLNQTYMSNPSGYITNDDLVHKVLLDPIRHGADRLIIISGYVSHNMASWHMKKINEESLPPIHISVIAGMYPIDGVNIELHEGLKDLVNFYDKHYSSFECKYVYQGAPVHSKVYLWMKRDVPFAAFSGSADYTKKGFGNTQREHMTDCDPLDAFAFYQSLEADTIICNHNEVEEYVKFYKDQKITQFKQETNHSSSEKVTLSLLTSRGDVGYGSGINWGIRRNGTKREPNQAYISVPSKIARSGFFPLDKAHFSAITDDHKQLILRIEQDNNKALTTPLNNSLLGEYLRNRIGVANGAFVNKADLERYGRTDVTFYKIDDEQFLMDFSVQ